MDINILTEEVKNSFAFLNSFGYSFIKNSINDANPNAVWVTLIAENKNKTEIKISFCQTNSLCRIDTSIYSQIFKRYLEIRNYINYLAGNEAGRVARYIIDMDDFKRGLNIYALEMKKILSKELINAVMDKSWEGVPAFDPRDDY